ncbi:hypothetical protein HK104_002308 [Borealophlyctis nickersoniae]|nr:hypothetical protein HK104_002308 [Borealophlyctis nickersoniae]
MWMAFRAVAGHSEALEQLADDQRKGVNHFQTMAVILMKGDEKTVVPRVTAVLEAFIASGFQLTAQEYGLLVMAHGDNFDYNTALSLLASMRAAELKPDETLVNKMLKPFVKRGDPESIQRLLAVLSKDGFRTTVAQKNAIIAAHAQKGDAEALAAGRAFLEEIVEQGPRIPLDKGSFRNLISAYVRAGNMVEARAVYDEMHSVGVFPDVDIYTDMIIGYANQGKVDEAAVLMAKIRTSGLKPHLWVYSCFATSHIHRDKNLDAAIRIVERAVDSGLLARLPAYNTLMNHWGQVNGDLSGTLKIYETLRSRQLEPDGETYLYLLQAYARAPEPPAAEATETFRSLYSSGIVPTVEHYNALLTVSAKTDVDIALRRLQKMKDLGVKPNQESCDIVVGALLKAGRAGEAENLRYKMEKELAVVEEDDGEWKEEDEEVDEIVPMKGVTSLKSRKTQKKNWWVKEAQQKGQGKEDNQPDEGRKLDEVRWKPEQQVDEDRMFKGNLAGIIRRGRRPNEPPPSKKPTTQPRKGHQETDGVRRVERDRGSASRGSREVDQILDEITTSAAKKRAKKR